MYKKNIDAEEAPSHSDIQGGNEAAIIEELVLKAERNKTIIWATGYKFDFSWIKVPLLDQDDCPIQYCGIIEFPGLYFLGFEPDIMAMIYNSAKLLVV